MLNMQIFANHSLMLLSQAFITYNGCAISYLRALISFRSIAEILLCILIIIITFNIIITTYW